MSNYTPTTEQVRDHFSVDRLLGGFVHTIHDADAEFDRWLAEVKAEALREAADAMRLAKEPGHWNLRDPYDAEASYSPDVWLEYRAAQIAGTTEAGDDRG